MRKWFLLLLAVVALLLSTSVVFANHAWANYHWARTSNPFTLKVVDNMTTNWDSYRAQALADWSASTVLDLASVAGNDSSGARKSCKAVLGKVVACNAAYGSNGWLGLAQIWVYSDGHIAKATSKMNDTYFNTSAYNTPAWKQFVMCQEPGHTLGLAHQDETFNNPNLGSCMDYTSNPGTNQHPNAHDYEQLEIIYAHLDSKTTVAASSASSARGASDDGGEFGRAIGKDGKGRANQFVKDQGNGQKLFTWVYWAD